MGQVGAGQDPNFFGIIGDKESSIHMDAGGAMGGGRDFMGEMSESSMSMLQPVGNMHVPHVPGPKSKMS
jgi:hypothetical protein